MHHRSDGINLEAKEENKEQSYSKAIIILKRILIRIDLMKQKQMIMNLNKFNFLDTVIVIIIIFLIRLI